MVKILFEKDFQFDETIEGSFVELELYLQLEEVTPLASLVSMVKVRQIQEVVGEGELDEEATLLVLLVSMVKIRQK